MVYKSLRMLKLERMYKKDKNFKIYNFLERFLVNSRGYCLGLEKFNLIWVEISI